MGNIIELSRNVCNNTNSVGLEPIALNPGTIKNSKTVIPYNTYNKIFIIPDSTSSDKLIQKFNLKSCYIGGTNYFTNEDNSFIMLVIQYAMVDFIPTFMGYFNSNITVVLLCPDKARYGISKDIFIAIETLIKCEVSYIPASILLTI